MNCVIIFSVCFFVMTVINIDASPLKDEKKHLISFNILQNESIQCHDGCTPLTDFCVCPPSYSDESRSSSSEQTTNATPEVGRMSEKELAKCKCYWKNGHKYCRCKPGKSLLKKKRNRKEENEAKKLFPFISNKEDRCSNHGFYNLNGACICQEGFYGNACEYEDTKVTQNDQHDNTNSVYLKSLCEFLMNHEVFKKQEIVIGFCIDIKYELSG